MQPDPDSADLTKPDAPTTPLPGGGIGLDIGPALAAAELLHLLRELGINTEKPQQQGH